MSDELQEGQARAVELLELYDKLDLLDEKLRAQKTAIELTTLVSIVLAAPLLIVLFLNHVRFFAAYPSTFIIILAAILCALTVERRRLKEEREELRAGIHQMEDVPPVEPTTPDRSADGLLHGRAGPDASSSPDPGQAV